jgi:eukaryotic-like serine/threonine-protein kinase
MPSGLPPSPPSAWKPPACVVPDVTLRRLAAAKRAIVAHRCRLGRVTRIYSFQVPRGLVISQSPWGGRHLKKGARVSLVVSRGRPPRR